ncbi:Shikimate kinase I [Methanosarcina sp. MTP4]|uniref:shikimate kinase n=1 Tax=Methanosarcina sp. MTP4 TaxID=1434100 RepID=UPI000615C9BD|nr:shikimate kinase [Methanosarcina sp. MTP4]AKB24705.1 Shikimate kinase I [Methanosarcina sp. MTP4]
MNITLIGMAGVGKSTIGKALAKRLSCTFIDVDSLIKEKTCMSLQALIDTRGDSALVRLEEEAVLSLDLRGDSIISPGGSVVYSEKAMNFLKEKSTIIFLDTSFRNIVRRIRNPAKRGLVGFKERSLRELFEERLVLYRKYADMTVKVKGHERVPVVVEKILEGLESLPDSRC